MDKDGQLSPWQQWAAQISQTLNEQQRRIALLEQQVTALQTELAQLRERPTYRIDRIEYQFDQLKVQQLDGTLHIGMNLPGEDGKPASMQGQVEQLITQHGAKSEMKIMEEPVHPEKPAPPPPELQQYLSKYMENHAPQSLARLMEKMQLKLDEHHQSLILGDIANQLAQRSQLYWQQTVQALDNSKDANQRQAQIKQVYDKLVADIEAALQAYTSRLTNKGGTS